MANAEAVCVSCVGNDTMRCQSTNATNSAAWLGVNGSVRSMPATRRPSRSVEVSGAIVAFDPKTRFRSFSNGGSWLTSGFMTIGSFRGDKVLKDVVIFALTSSAAILLLKLPSSRPAQPPSSDGAARSGTMWSWEFSAVAMNDSMTIRRR